MSTFDRARAEAVDLLVATGLVSAGAVQLAEPKPNIPADLAFPVFAVAKAAGGANPAEFAQRLARAVNLLPNGLIGSVTAAGGFANFALAPERFTPLALAEVLELGDDFGKSTLGAGQTVVVEYSSPNIAKKLHVGSLRTTVIGHAIYQILRALGYHTVGDNHLGDWGTQFGYLLAALHEKELTPWNDPDPVASLMRIYAEYYAASEADPVLKNNARAWFKRLEDGDEWARATWKKLIDLSLAEFDKTYQRLDITFDTQRGESFFEPLLGEVVEEAITKGVARVEPEGAVSVDFGDKLPSCLLRKTDGATLYQTRDAATCLWRWREYQPARNIYVVGGEQKLHFQQVFEVARRMGYEEIADRSVHIPFGMVTSVEGERFRTRQGNVIFADEVLDEAVARATTKITEKIAEGKAELPPSEIPVVAEMIGVGAVVYYDLHQGPDRNIRFDWDKVIAWEGNTALYIQYTHARCRSILRKATSWPNNSGAHGALLCAPEEQTVVKQLARFPHAVREAGEKFLPAVIAAWTYDLAREFARFYHECPVLEAPTPGLRDARLVLVAAVAQGLKNGLTLLGIKAPERM